MARSKTISPQLAPIHRMYGLLLSEITPRSQSTSHCQPTVLKGTFMACSSSSMGGGVSSFQISCTVDRINSRRNRRRYCCKSISSSVVLSVISSPISELNASLKSSRSRNEAARLFSSSLETASGLDISLIVVKMVSSRFSRREGSNTFDEVSC